MNSLVGQVIENYRIETLLGEGGMGEVYRAIDLNLNRPVAFKVMHQNLGRQTQFQQRFMQEARAAARLKHPSIVTIYAFDNQQGLLYIVMEYVDGVGLGAYIRQVIQRNQVVRLNETLYLLAQAADALGFAHRQGVVHRDIKPDNILIEKLSQPERPGEPPLRAKITDFGLAKLVEGGLQTATGTFMGTLPYMSPEQCLGTPLDGRSDIYSLGIMLYLLTTGRLPFDIKTPAEAALKHIQQIPPAPRSIRPGIPPAIEAIITKTLAKKAEDRYQTGEQLAQALRQAAARLTDADVTRFAPPQATMSLATRIISTQQIALPSQFGSHLAPPPEGDQLTVAEKGQSPYTVGLNKPFLTIGRTPECDIVLKGTGVSRQHARLEKTPSGWQVVDLGSTNGTLLAESKLLPDIPAGWDAGVQVRVGPFFLQWKPAETQFAAPAQGTYHATQRLPASGSRLHQPVVPAGASHIYSTDGQISVTVNPTNIDTNPGEQSFIEITLLNQGATVDHFRLSLDGLPPDWYTISTESVQLMPANQGILHLTIHPPADSSARAGSHPYTLIIQGQANPSQRASVPGNMIIQPFEKFSLDMRPKALTNEGIARLLIRNEGNTAATYTVSGRDPSEVVDFSMAQNTLHLPAGNSGTLDINLTPRTRPWLGTSKNRPFQIGVTSERLKSPQYIPGHLDVKPILPPWTLPLLSLLAVLCCISSVIGLNYFQTNQDSMAATSQALAAIQTSAIQTRNATEGQVAQQTAQAGQATNIAATFLAQTAIAAGDDDGDGLSNEQEQALGTNPNNEDTDGDGLLDGQEVNQFATNPQGIDSDGDGLTDGEEVNEHDTSPSNSDSDGDGVPDGVEINQGTDPNLPPTPTMIPTDQPTPTPTAPPTATSTLPPDTPTPTPTSTPTSTPQPVYALQFDGNDDYVAIPDSGDFDFNNAFTIEAWVKPSSIASDGSFSAIAQGASSEPPFSGAGWSMYLGTADYSNWGLSVCVPGCNAAGSGIGSLVVNEWQHVASVYDGSEIRLYRNGTLIASEAHAGNVSDIDVLLIGIWTTSFRGQIDEFRVWNVARTARQIDSTMNDLLAGSESGLVGYWRFDEGSGQTVTDLSGRGNDGKLGPTFGNDGQDPVWVESDAPVSCPPTTFCNIPIFISP